MSKARKQVRRIPERRRAICAITLPAPLVARADALADSLSTTRSGLIELALERVISERPTNAAEIFSPRQEAV